MLPASKTQLLQIDTRRLRHPLERPIFVTCAVLNVVVMLIAFYVALVGSGWLSTHPLFNAYKSQLHAIAIAFVLGPAAITFLRNTRHAEILANSGVISPKQLPQLHNVLTDHCRRMGKNSIPELYFSNRATKEPARGYKSWRKEYIVLGTAFLQPDLSPMLPVFSFLIARELGRLQLGHCNWGMELLVSYVEKIPYIRNPLSHVFTFSRDRWGAVLTSDFPVGLVALAVGRLMLPAVNVEAFLRDASVERGKWEMLAELKTEKPSVARRLRALRDAGLLDPQIDLL
jgi:hypothetical protein